MNKTSQTDNELLNAIRLGNLLKVQQLISTGLNVNAYDITIDDWTPLMLAIHLEHIDIVKTLIDFCIARNRVLLFIDNT